MHDAGARQFGQAGVEVQQGVDHRAARVAGTGMHDQAGGFVHHQHVLVLEQDVERDVLGLRVGLDLHLHRQGHGLAAAHGLLGLDHPAAQQGVAGLDPFGQAGAGEIREQLGQHLVEAAAGGGQGNAGFQQLALAVVGFVDGGLGHGDGHLVGPGVGRAPFMEATPGFPVLSPNSLAPAP